MKDCQFGYITTWRKKRTQKETIHLNLIFAHWKRTLWMNFITPWLATKDLSCWLGVCFCSLQSPDYHLEGLAKVEWVHIMGRIPLMPSVTRRQFCTRVWEETYLQDFLHIQVKRRVWFDEWQLEMLLVCYLLCWAWRNEHARKVTRAFSTDIKCELRM